ncbi:MAG: hypothetical protein K2P51_01050 [Rhabdochlamydiaceae bacterium]|nr:hypothetical protein [Rhabdochlamydiaceae bacterium]
MLHAITSNPLERDPSSLSLIANGESKQMTSTATKVAGIFTVILAVLAGGLILGPFGLIGAPLLTITLLHCMSTPVVSVSSPVQTYHSYVPVQPSPPQRSWWSFLNTTPIWPQSTHRAGGPLPPSPSFSPPPPRIEPPLFASPSTPAGSHFGRTHIARPEDERPNPPSMYATGTHFGRGHFG